MGSALLGLRAVKDCYYSLETPEAVTAVIPFFPVILSVPGKDVHLVRNQLATDVTFWRVFDFSFIQGAAYSEEDFESGIQKVVISERIARELYGRLDVVNESIELNKKAFTICGVVQNVSTIAENAYADIWVPYSLLQKCSIICMMEKC